MEAIGSLLTAEIMKAMQDGDFKSFMGYAAIFLVIWLELRALKKEFAKLNLTIADSFKKGEDRFTNIETDIKTIKTDIMVIKQITHPLGG